MRTPTALLLCIAAAAPLAGAAPAAAAWSPTQGFSAGPARNDETVPRAAIATDGTSAVVYQTRAGALMLTTGTPKGRFSAPRRIVASGARSYSIAAAPGGAFLVAWEDAGGLRAAVRTRTGRSIVRRSYPGGPASEINGVQVAADPEGGWAVAERVFANRLYRVRALSLDPAGRPLGEAQDLGLGEFGIDARPTQAIAVDSSGRAVLAFKREAPLNAPFPRTDPVVVATRPHGGAFSVPVALAGPAAADPRVAVDGDGHALIAFTRISTRGDAGSFGAPAVARVLPDGTLGPSAGPELEFPSRAFGPTAAFTPGGAALVFALKTKSQAFVTEAPVRAVALNADGSAGPLQTLTSGQAKEPVAMALTGGRVLVVWSGRKGIGASLATGGVFRKTAEPKGPPPPPNHFNSTNRDLRTAGRYAIFTWARAGRVRVAVRGF